VPEGLSSFVFIENIAFCRPRIGSTGDERAVVFFVRDNGGRFDVQYYNKLFGVWQLLHYAEGYEGTGIGLASVRGIIGHHAGRAKADSCFGRGGYLLLLASAIHGE
jgi:light-regulated signal transduction histidine kinase (bacteriophytochrome)